MADFITIGATLALCAALTNGGIQPTSDTPDVAIDSFNLYIDGKLNCVGKTNNLRNTIPEIARGSPKEIVSDSENKYLILEKEYNNDLIYIVFNFSDQENKIDLSSVNYNEVIGEINLNYNDKSSFSGSSMDAKPYSISILR